MNTIPSIYSPITSLYLDRFIEVTEKQNEYGYIFLSKNEKGKEWREKKKDVLRDMFQIETVPSQEELYFLKQCASDTIGISCGFV